MDAQSEGYQEADEILTRIKANNVEAYMCFGVLAVVALFMGINLFK